MRNPSAYHGAEANQKCELNAQLQRQLVAEFAGQRAQASSGLKQERCEDEPNLSPAFESEAVRMLFAARRAGFAEVQRVGAHRRKVEGPHKVGKNDPTVQFGRDLANTTGVTRKRRIAGTVRRDRHRFVWARTTLT